MKGWAIAVGLCGALGWAQGVQAASFDCGKAKALVERLICGSPEASTADERLAAAYRALLARAEAVGLADTARDRLKTEQRAWVADRDRRCLGGVGPNPKEEEARLSADCLAEMTGQRRAALERLAAGLPISALIEARRLEEKEPAKGYELEAAWPVLPASVAGAAAFNQATEAKARSQADGFRDSQNGEDPPPPDQPSGFSLDYEVTYASPRLVSVQFDVYDYPSGAAHGNYGAVTLHFDLTAGKELAAEDLFRADADWRRAVIDHCRSELRRRESEGEFELYDEDNSLEDAIAASATDVNAWRLEADQAVVIFSPYQVAAYAVGFVEVPVSYALLRPFLKPGGPLPAKS